MVKWFGQSWGAPVCEPKDQVPVPIGELCTACFKPIESDAQGVLVPTLYGDPLSAWHLDCWFREIGIEVTAEVLASKLFPDRDGATEDE